jgi:hypothetical protein
VSFFFHFSFYLYIYIKKNYFIMSNKFLNPSGETDLSDVIARVNGNTEAIQTHVEDLANPHTTSTDNIQGTNSPPLNSDDVVEGVTNKFLVQPFTGDFDMGGFQIINATAVGNPAGQTAIGGASSVTVYDPTVALSTGVLTQTFGGKSVETIADDGFIVEATNGEVQLDATNGNVSISSGGAFPNGGVVISNTNATAGVVLLDSTTGNSANVSSGGVTLLNTAGVLSLQQNDNTNLLELKTTTLNLNLDEANTKVSIGGGDLDMNGNDILNAGNVALTSINTNIIYVSEGTMPSSFVADRTYIFEGSRSTATPIVLPAGPITLKGMSRENSTIEYTGAGALFTSTDQNLTIADLGWSCTNTAGYFLDATNAARDKLLTIQNCEFREAFQVMRLEGYDLVDFQNNVLTYIRSGALLPAYGVDCIDVSKLEINSCEFIRWYEFGQPVNTNAFIGNMINISGSNGATQITNNIIHPRVAQNGIDIDAVATFSAGVNITGNTFVNAGLTAGVVLETNSNADYDEKAITEANSLLPNLKARVGAQLSAVNTITTATSGTPADINLNNLLVAFDQFGVTVGAGGGVTYNRTRPVNFQVTFVANLQAITGGANQRVGLTVSKDGLNTGVNSFVNLDSAGTEPKTVTLTLIGSAVQGNVFRSQLINTSASSNITCTDLIVSGIEI